MTPRMAWTFADVAPSGATETQGDGGYQGGTAPSLLEGPGKTGKVEGCQQRACLWVAIGHGPLASGGKLAQRKA